jgi:CECR6/TMEM121 family
MPEIRQLLSRILSTVAVLAQGLILDYYIIHYNGSTWAPWIVADVVTVLAMITAFVYSKRYFVRYDQVEQDENHRKVEKDWKEGDKVPRPPAILPLGYLSWLVYSSLLVARIVVIFKTFGSNLNGEEFWGTNLLEFVIAGTAGIFAFMLAGRTRRPTASQKVCLKFLQSHVLLEIIDSVEFMTILFTAEHNLMIPE